MHRGCSMKTSVFSERGIATFLALIMMAMLTIIGLAALSTSDDEVQIAGNEWQEARAFWAAESGLSQASANLQVQYEVTGAPPTYMPSGEVELNNCVISYQTTDDGPATRTVLTNGTMAGLHALAKSYTITSTATNTSEPGQIKMTQTFQAALVPIFQFAVFYDNDLEINPGPAMRLIGRVHTNGDLYIQSDNSLRMDSYVTSAGQIIHDRKGAGGAGFGDVSIKDASGAYVSMQEASGWLDSNDSYWFDSSMARWQGRVQDSSHGQTELNLPLENVDDPHKIIEPADANPDSYENKAALKCIDGVWYQKQGGIWQDVTGALQSAGVIADQPDQFYDGREEVGVDVMQLDVGALYSSGYAPDNGVIYFSDASSATSANDYPALRLVNGAQLGAPLTVASENPVYTLGDFNSVNKQPASILADALTFLSGSFDDTKTDPTLGWTKDDRVAVNTTANVSYITGNVETTDLNYNGGLENLPRFLEVWSGVNFTWAGSAVNLWNSLQATGNWSGTYYTPPDRIWSYDTDLDDPNKLPPETPCVRVFQRTGWKQEYVGYGIAME